MGSEDFLSAVGSIANALFLIASVYIYVALLRQINRHDPIETDRDFGSAEVALAIFLIAVFAFSSLGASSAQIVRLRTPATANPSPPSVIRILCRHTFLMVKTRNRPVNPPNMTIAAGAAGASDQAPPLSTVPTSPRP